MRFNAEVIPVATGSYGPFKDDNYPDDRSKDRTYTYYDLAAVDGSGSERATLAQDTNGNDVSFVAALFKPVAVALELHGKARKLRLHGLALSPVAKAA